jgi:hypothetical protein
MAGVESCLIFAKKLSASKINTYLVPYLFKFGEDKETEISRSRQNNPNFASFWG